jgi:uncharacterized protein (UPF0335 family)
MTDLDDIQTGTVHGAQLRGFVARVEALNESAREVAEFTKEVYAEAKGNGFDVRILRKVVALRKKSADDRSEEEAMLDLYLQALGMLGDAA